MEEKKKGKRQFSKNSERKLSLNETENVGKYLIFLDFSIEPMLSNMNVRISQSEQSAVLFRIISQVWCDN